MSKPPGWFRPYAPRISWIEFNQNVQIDLVNRYAYFEVAKAACSTVKRRLMPLVARGLPDTKTVHPTVYESAFVKPFQLPNPMMRRVLAGDRFLRFTFLREPTERFVSGYLDKIVRDTPQKARFVQRHYPDLEPGAEITLEMFLSAVETETDPRQIDKHWRAQHDLLFQPEQAFDFIGTVDRLEDGWSELSERIPAIAQTARENVVWHATSAASRVTETLNADQKRRVETLMERDFELYARHAGGA